MQEFVIDGVDYAGQGYQEAAAGETFVKIGVGVLRRPDAEPYRFSPDMPLMVLEHTLRNDGDRRIEGAVYNHNFMLIDGDRPGPQIVLTHPFDLRVTQTGRSGAV